MYHQYHCQTNFYRGLPCNCLAKFKVGEHKPTELNDCNIYIPPPEPLIEKPQRQFDRLIGLIIIGLAIFWSGFTLLVRHAW